MGLLVNHVGYDTASPKKAVFQGKMEDKAGAFVLCTQEGQAVYRGTARECGPVARWNTGYYWTLEFSDYKKPGRYQLCLETSGGEVRSDVFEIRDRILTMRMLNGASYYFKAQRSSGEWLLADRSLEFTGQREGIVDCHGGWYDATGDYGIHLSHLSHGSVHNPQQAAFSAYGFFKAVEWLEKSGNKEYTMLKRRMLDEGTFGADFLMRMRAPSGSFFRSINRSDALRHVRGTRAIGFEYHESSSQFSEKAATADKEQVTDDNYEVSLRSGGGTAIAALAIASRHYYPGTDFTREEYLLAAKDGWNYLSEHNERYTNDGRWNLIDEYCSLLALVELYKASGEYEYLESAGEMAGRMEARLRDNGEGRAYFTSQEDQPYYHASDEGLPVIALLEYAEIEPEKEKREKAVQAARKVMEDLLCRTNEAANPFGYPRILHKNQEGQLTAQFFFPHDTSVAPWWQGENARIASLSAAARQLSYVTSDKDLAKRLQDFAEDQLNWILGLNPFDSCMMEGYGKNNIQYFFKERYDFINCPGGICNGITGGLEDEEGICFVMEPGQIDDNWRWAEQWIPHVTWFLYAQALKKV